MTPPRKTSRIKEGQGAASLCKGAERMKERSLNSQTLVRVEDWVLVLETSGGAKA